MGRTLRILFTFAGGSGHAEPLVSLARAGTAAGHTIAFAGRPAVVAQLAERGFAVVADPASAIATPTAIAPLLPLDLEHEQRVLRDGFAGRVARARAASVLALCARWAPDVIVCDEMDCGGMVAAERAGVPHATVLVGAPGFVRWETLADVVNALRSEHGLAAEAPVAMPGRQLVISPFPPSYRDAAAEFPVTAHAVCLAALEPGDAGALPWLRTLPAAPTVYLTLGTVFNMESGDLFARAVSGLRELPIRLVVTVGRELATEALGPQPANVHVERYLPQAALLRHCDAVVSHAGSGTVLGAIAAGLPQVLLPMGADQPQNAARCAELGLGVALDALTASPGAIGVGVTSVLADPGYREAATRLRDELAALPTAAHALQLIEQLVAA